MRYRVEVNRSQSDARAVIVLPYALSPNAIPIGTGVHVLTDAELRARDERIIHAARQYIHDYDPGGGGVSPLYDAEVATIIAAAEAET